MSELVERKCGRCPAKIVFAEGPNGNAIPLQRVRRVYSVADGKAFPLALENEAEVKTYVSHFETCPAASSFSRGRKS